MVGSDLGRDNNRARRMAGRPIQILVSRDDHSFGLHEEEMSLNGQRGMLQIQPESSNPYVGLGPKDQVHQYQVQQDGTKDKEATFLLNIVIKLHLLWNYFVKPTCQYFFDRSLIILLWMLHKLSKISNQLVGSAPKYDVHQDEVEDWTTDEEEDMQWIMSNMPQINIPERYRVKGNRLRGMLQIQQESSNPFVGLRPKNKVHQCQVQQDGTTDKEVNLLQNIGINLHLLWYTFVKPTCQIFLERSLNILWWMLQNQRKRSNPPVGSAPKDDVHQDKVEDWSTDEEEDMKWVMSNMPQISIPECYRMKWKKELACSA